MSIPSAGGAIRNIVERMLRQVNTAIPARVESFDRVRKTVSAQPLIPVTFKDESGARQVANLPIIASVPVLYGGGGGCKIQFPLAKGDTVLLIVAQASLDKWFTTGRIVDPVDPRRHALTDAIALPGLQSGDDAEGDPVHETAMTIDAPEIHAGGTEPLALLSELNTLRTHVAGLMVGGSGSALNATAPAAFTGTTVLKGS